jgi:hypothetical protein
MVGNWYLRCSKLQEKKIIYVLIAGGKYDCLPWTAFKKSKKRKPLAEAVMPVAHIFTKHKFYRLLFFFKHY